MLRKDSLVIRKTLELCEAILEQPEYRSIQERVLAFEEDEQAQGLYEALIEKEQELSRERNSGAPVGETELAELDCRWKELVENPVAKAFLDARDEAQEIQARVHRYISGTFELGCVPKPEDMEGCGQGCSCH